MGIAQEIFSFGDEKTGIRRHPASFASWKGWFLAAGDRSLDAFCPASADNGSMSDTSRNINPIPSAQTHRLVAIGQLAYPPCLR